MNNISTESTVYLNKIFSDIRIGSCPLMSSLTAASENFNQTLSFFDPPAPESDSCGCSCSCTCTGEGTAPGTGENLRFVIDSTEVIVSDFNPADPSSITACNVTADGIPVDSLEFFNDRYTASASELNSKVSDCGCIEKGLSTKVFFMIAGAGPWRTKLTLILRGSVFGAGSCRKFKLVMTTKDNVFVNIPGQATFASSEVCLPCTAGGIAPVISFSFDANATLLNPCISVESACGSTWNFSVTGCLVAEPFADVQVTRQTLFRTNAQSVNVPCDDIEKCRQSNPVCGEKDDDSNAVSLHNRCCEDKGSGSSSGGGGCGGCGCGSNTNSQSCGCGHSSSCGTASCSCSVTGTSHREQENKNRTAVCQFNGRNGCSF